MFTELLNSSLIIPGRLLCSSFSGVCGLLIQPSDSDVFQKRLTSDRRELGESPLTQAVFTPSLRAWEYSAQPSDALKQSVYDKPCAVSDISDRGTLGGFSLPQAMPTQTSILSIEAGVDGAGKVAAQLFDIHVQTAFLPSDSHS